MYRFSTCYIVSVSYSSCTGHTVTSIYFYIFAYTSESVIIPYVIISMCVSIKNMVHGWRFFFSLAPIYLYDSYWFAHTTATDLRLKYVSHQLLYVSIGLFLISRALTRTHTITRLLRLGFLAMSSENEWRFFVVTICCWMGDGIKLHMYIISPHAIRVTNFNHVGSAQ